MQLVEIAWTTRTDEFESISCNLLGLVKERNHVRTWEL
jgi:hypothetical protein